MIKIECDECKGEVLNKENMCEIGSNDEYSLYIKSPKRKMTRYHNLHFCDHNCLNKFFYRFIPKNK